MLPVAAALTLTEPPPLLPATHADLAGARRDLARRPCRAPRKHRLYEKRDPVEMVGEYSIRGGILDVFSPDRRSPCASSSSATRSNPSAGSIRRSQRSIHKLNECVLQPLTEFQKSRPAARGTGRSSARIRHAQPRFARGRRALRGLGTADRRGSPRESSISRFLREAAGRDRRAGDDEGRRRALLEPACESAPRLGIREARSRRARLGRVSRTRAQKHDVLEIRQLEVGMPDARDASTFRPAFDGVPRQSAGRHPGSENAARSGHRSWPSSRPPPAKSSGWPTSSASTRSRIRSISPASARRSICASGRNRALARWR